MKDSPPVLSFMDIMSQVHRFSWNTSGRSQVREDIGKNWRRELWAMMCCSRSRPSARRREHLDRQLESRTGFFNVGETKVSLESIVLYTCKYAISSFTVNPLRRQQENIAFIRNNDCDSMALTLSGATPTARTQAPGSCPLHTSENKNIQILSRTESCYGLRHGCSRDTALPSSPSGLQRGVEENSLAYLHELSVKLLLLCDG